MLKKNMTTAKEAVLHSKKVVILIIYIYIYLFQHTTLRIFAMFRILLASEHSSPVVGQD